MHAEAPLVAENVPALQVVGATLPVEQYDPAGHSVQSLASALSVALEYVVAGQGSGAEAPSGQYEPSTHASHSVMPSSSWYVPPPHAEHWSAPSAEIVPALQLVGATLPVEQYAPAGQVSQSAAAALSVALE